MINWRLVGSAEVLLVFKILETHEIVGVVAFFLIVQFMGLLIAFTVAESASQALLLNRLVGPQTVALSYGVDILLFLIILLLILNRHRKHNSEIWNHRFYKAFEAIVLTATSFFAFLFFFTAVLPLNLQSFYFIVSLVCAALIVAVRERTRIARNTATAVSSIGVGLVLGFYFSFEYAIIILAVISVYDYISVFVTKTMIKLASTLTSEDVAFLISEEDLEAIPAERVSIGEIASYERELKQAHKDQDPLYRGVMERGDIPVVSQIQLGEGDLGLPLMAVVSSLFTFSYLFIPVTIAIGAAVGLLITILFLKRYRRPLPAIPPLFSLIAIVSGAVLWFKGYIPYNQALALVVIGVLIVTLGMGMQLWKKRKADAEARAADEKKKQRGRRG
jgi:presenilin-like A22 family membrane protease